MSNGNIVWKTQRYIVALTSHMIWHSKRANAHVPQLSHGFTLLAPVSSPSSSQHPCARKQIDIWKTEIRLHIAELSFTLFLSLSLGIGSQRHERGCRSNPLVAVSLTPFLYTSLYAPPSLCTFCHSSSTNNLYSKFVGASGIILAQLIIICFHMSLSIVCEHG